MKLLKKIMLVLFIACLTSACDEDEYAYPDVITEFMCLQTDAHGIGYRLITDDGKTMTIPEKQRPNDKLTPDSTYRVISKYVPKNDEADVYVLQSVNAPLPKLESEFEEIHTDAVTIQSIWQSGYYLNLILQVMVKDQKHQFAFIENGITRDSEGKQTLSITLFHNRNNDIEGFYRKAYLSIPLWYYKDQLNKGDRIELHLNTYEEGMTSRMYSY
jgi:hypothetical protein